MAEPSHDPRREALRQATQEVAADLRAWAEWADTTGVSDIPTTPPEQQPQLARTSGPPTERTVRAGDRQGRVRAAIPPQLPSRPIPRVVPSQIAAPQPSPVVTRTASGERETIAAVRAALGDCQRCRLASGRQHIVFGVGNPDARLVLVGEAPGYYEDVTGEPLVGRSGQLLTRMLSCIGLERTEVYICNVLKCRPPDNRDPQADEVAMCSPFLTRQIEAVSPRVILTLGRFAATSITGVDDPLGRLRNQVHQWHGIPTIATYHPSYLLRNPIEKRAAWADFLTVRRLLRE